MNILKTYLPKAAIIASIAGVISCGNPRIVSTGKCDPSESTAQKSFLALTEDSGTSLIKNEPVQLGGFLVFDKYDIQELYEKSIDEAQLKKDQLCSSTFRFKRTGTGYSVQFLTSYKCYESFMIQGKNRRILVSLPNSTPQYVALNISDKRFQSVESYFNEIKDAAPDLRRQMVEGLEIPPLNGSLNVYIKLIKKLNAPDEKLLREKLCAISRKATPTPETCAWFLDTFFDEVNLKIDSKTDLSRLDSLVNISNNYESAKYANLNSADRLLSDKIRLYTENFTKIITATWKINAFGTSVNLLTCKDAVDGDICFGKRRKIATLPVALFAPEYLPLIEGYLTKTDRDSAASEGSDKYSQMSLEQVDNGLFSPAIEAYLSVMDKASKSPSLVSIMANHLHTATVKPDQFSFQDLSPFGKILPPALKGITVSFENSHILIKNEDKTKNQNLSLDGQDGSVLAIGGIPFQAFTPSSIDQSDRTSTMPLPDPGNTQVPLRDKAKDSSGTKDTTNGKGLKSDRANCAL